MINRIFKRKAKEVVVETPKEVLDSKRELKMASDAAIANTKKVKRLLVTDYVTLSICIATQGAKHV